MYKRASSMMLGLILVFALASCSEESIATGDLQVRYRIGSGSSNCDDVDIHSVRVYLLTSGGAEVADETFACDPAGQTVLLEGIEAGSYAVRVEGLDRGSDVVYTGELDDMVDVAGNQTNGPVTVVLTQLRPALLLWLDFAEAGNCSRFEVEDIVIVLYENGASPIYDETFGCADRLADSLLIEGLSDSAYYDLRIRGTNSNGEYTYEYDEDGITVSAGAPTERAVELESCDGLCTDP